MNDARALLEIQRLASLDRIVLRRHAMERMHQRRARLGDVRRALVSATSATAQERGGWRVEGGLDRDGDDLIVIVDIEADVIVITLF